MTAAVERVWNGDADLEGMLRPVETLTRHPRNPRRGQVALIKESLARFGQTRPVLVDDADVIVAGNHTYLAIRDLGWTHVAAVRNRFADEAEARAYMVADNRLAELGGYEDSQLLALLEELEQTGGWEGTGYDPDALDDLRALQDRVAETDAEEFMGDFAATPEELAARALRLAAGRTLSEVVLTLTAGQATDFDNWTKILARSHGTSGVTETVLRAVTDAATREP